ncbi:TVP38/TMEM64 family protein [Ectothiorhodospiraceae bacterium WFHF3C12]|nr:TVP38/TMEM64 family protein [Ectothiorhodospiraceae bacterium WFHF3C12]
MSASAWLRVGVLALLLIATVVLASAVDWREWLSTDLIEQWLHGTGAWGPWLFMASMAAAIVVSPLPSLPLGVAGGTVFGVALGTLYAATGALVGALLSFWIARTLGRDVVERFVGHHVHLCGHCNTRVLFLVVFVSRLIPFVSFDVVSYGAGLTAMSARSFAVATFFGMLPMTAIYAGLGDVMVFRPEFAIAFGVLMVAAFFALPRWIARRNPFGLAAYLPHEREED